VIIGKKSRPLATDMHQFCINLETILGGSLKSVCGDKEENGGEVEKGGD
jgi:hypothetical protein